MNIYKAIASIPWRTMGDSVVPVFASVTSTAVGAFVGAILAFAFERKKREDDVAALQAAAIRRALFALTRAHGFISSIDREFCIPIAAEPVLRVIMRPFLNTSLENWTFDVEALDFLLGTPHLKIMLDLQGREAAFSLLDGLMRKRSETMIEVIQPAVARLSPPRYDGLANVDLKALEDVVGKMKIYEVTQLADEIVQIVSHEMAAIPKLQSELRKVAGELFPKMDFQYLALAAERLRAAARD